MILDLFEIEDYYDGIEKDLERFYSLAKHEAKEQGVYFDLVKFCSDCRDVFEKAKRYDIEKYKRSQGGKKSANNMTAEERKARAQKAGSTVKPTE